MRIAWIALLMMVSFCAWADSNPPIPSPSKATQDNQSGTKHETQPSAEIDKFRGTQSPLVELQFNAPVNQTKSDEKPQKSDEHSSIDWWGIIVSVSTLAIIGFQSWIYLKQRDLMAVQARIMSEAAKDARNASNTQSNIMGNQHDILQSQLRLEQAQFHATYRPKLVVRGLFLQCAYVDRRITIHFMIYNAGDASAEVENFKFFAPVRNQELYEQILMIPDMNKPPFTLEVGNEIRCTAVSNSAPKLIFQYMDANNIEIYATDGTDVSFEFRGDITFLDGARKTRHCSFHRSYDFQNRRFTKIVGSEFEYSD